MERCLHVGDVLAFKGRIKASRSRLREVELRNMTVLGPWATKPLVTDIAPFLDVEPCDPATILSDLIGDKQRAYFLVRITGPMAEPQTDLAVEIRKLVVQQAQLGARLGERLDALELREAQPRVNAHRWMDRQSIQVKLSSDFAHFRRVVGTAVKASPAARLYWFPEAMVALVHRREIVETSFAEFSGYVRSTADPDVWVWEPTPTGMSPTQPPAAAVVPDPATPQRGSASRSARSSHVQRMFRAAVMRRDGLVCTLCRRVPTDERAIEAAHVVRHGSSSAVLEEAGLLSTNDSINGVMLCASPCHFWYDQLHWWVEPDGNVAASKALLEDAALGRHFSALIGHPLQRPQPAFLPFWPLPTTWAVQKRLCLEAADKRHEISADAVSYCVKCGKPYKSLRGLETHAAHCSATSRRLLFTPAERAARSDALAEGVDDDQGDDSSG